VVCGREFIAGGAKFAEEGAAVDDGLFVDNAAPTHANPAAPTATGGMRIESAGDSGDDGKRKKGRITSFDI
jgi:hypothetical protein